MSSSLTLTPPEAPTRIRWLHLSDFHVGKDEYGQRRLFKSLLEHIRVRINDNRAPDMVFITGDIANKGKADEYGSFYDNFYIPLYDLLPPESQERIFIVPGNHDVDRTQARAAQIYDVLLRVPEFLDPTEEGQFERSTIFPRFQVFVGNDFTTGSEEHWLISAEGALREKVNVKGQLLGVVGLNTAWLSCSDEDRHKLSAGKHLLEEGLEALDDCAFKIVLGHHPLDWFLDTDLDPVRALLGRHAAIYLHGHTHKDRARYEDGAGYSFIMLQSGACFQAREDDLWVNRFLWCELDAEARELAVEPLQWSRDDQEWTQDSTAFPNHYFREGRWVIPLPAPAQETLVSRSRPAREAKRLDLPDGWTVIDAQSLAERDVGLEREQALSYFDGREPRWREALAPQIPRREVAQRLAADIEAARKAGKLRVTLLTGAAGEGKSTAMLQAVVDLVRGNATWRVLWHFDTATPLPAESIMRLPKGEGAWLIVSDDAEMIARRIFDVVKELRGQGRRDVQFLLCARDTDWMNAKAPSSHNWRRYATFAEVRLRSLTLEDARKVVTAWQAYGQEGLQQLDGLDREEAAQRLVDAVKSEEASRHEGTFLGAMLQVRWGEAFKEHVANLLYKLDERPIPNTDLTLMNALAYIAAPHAENILILSKMVLAQVLGVSRSDFKRRVIGPLGEEAAIATTGNFVYTRHRAIAKATLEILSETFYVDIDELYTNLVKAALHTYKAGVYVPNLGGWRYLSSHFFDRGNLALGIHLAQTAHKANPRNPYLIVKLAQLYREAGQPEQSVRVFHGASESVEEDRGYYAEWGVAEGNAGNHALSVWLTAFSLADQATRVPPDNKRAKISLNSFCVAFAELFDRYNRPTFLQSRSAAAQLALNYVKLDPKTRIWFQGHQKEAAIAGVETVSSREALARLQQGIVAAWEQAEDELLGIPAANGFTFNGLARLLRIR